MKENEWTKETMIARIIQLEENLDYWKKAHIKLQEQMMKGRTIMYDGFDEIRNKLKDHKQGEEK